MTFVACEANFREANRLTRNQTFLNEITIDFCSSLSRKEIVDQRVSPPKVTSTWDETLFSHFIIFNEARSRFHSRFSCRSWKSSPVTENSCWLMWRCIGDDFFLVTLYFLLDFVPTFSLEFKHDVDKFELLTRGFPHQQPSKSQLETLTLTPQKKP